MELASRFVRGAGGSASLVALDELLTQIMQRARSRWSGVLVSDQDFVEFLAARLPPGDDALTHLSHLHTSDLFLTFACLRGDPWAVAAFDQHYVSNLRVSSHANFSAELKQVLRERLLVAQAGHEPRLSLYSGRGPLAGWLKITAAHLAADLRRSQSLEMRYTVNREVPLPPLDPELSYLKSRYRLEFEEAIERAFCELSTRETALLKLHFFDEMPVQGIARMYRVSRRTVQRWLAAAQTKILDLVRRDLGARLLLNDAELDSLLLLVISQLSVSLHRFLKPP